MGSTTTKTSEYKKDKKAQDGNLTDRMLAPIRPVLEFIDDVTGNTARAKASQQARRDADLKKRYAKFDAIAKSNITNAKTPEEKATAQKNYNAAVARRKILSSDD